MKTTKRSNTAGDWRNASVAVVVCTELPSMRTRWTIKPVGSNGWSARNF